MLFLDGSTFTNWFTATHWLVLTNIVLAAVAVVTIRSSTRVAKASEAQAGETTKSVEAATEQVKLGRIAVDQDRQAIIESSSPLIGEVPLGRFLEERSSGGTFQLPPRDLGSIWWVKSDDGLNITVPVRNIGKGPAFVRGAMLSAHPGISFDAKVDHRIIPAGEMAIVFASVDSDVPGGTGLLLSTKVEFSVSYSDISATQRRETVITISLAESGNPSSRRGIVEDVELYGCDESWTRADEPWVSSGMQRD